MLKKLLFEIRITHDSTCTTQYTWFPSLNFSVLMPFIDKSFKPGFYI